jgi:hypothetical protein
MEQLQTLSLIAHLKQETQPFHARIEKLPFITALSNGTLPLASYVNDLFSAKWREAVQGAIAAARSALA